MELAETVSGLIFLSSHNLEWMCCICTWLFSLCSSFLMRSSCHISWSILLFLGSFEGYVWSNLPSSERKLILPSSWLYLLISDIYIHWASKETYNFLEWCPLKSTASKWMIFGLLLATVLLITHVKKQRNRNCRKWDKCLQITTSPFSKITENVPFPPHRLRTFQYLFIRIQ